MLQDKRRWTAPNNWYGIAPNSAHMLPQPFCPPMMTIMIGPMSGDLFKMILNTNTFFLIMIHDVYEDIDKTKSIISRSNGFQMYSHRYSCIICCCPRGFSRLKFEKQYFVGGSGE